MCSPVLSIFSSLPDARHRGCCLAVDADAAIDSLVTAASWSSSSTQCSSWQRLQSLPLLMCTKVLSFARLCGVTLEMLFRWMLRRDLVRDSLCLFFSVTVHLRICCTVILRPPFAFFFFFPWWSTLFFHTYTDFLYFTVAPGLSSGYVFLTLVKGIWFCFHVQSQPLKTFETVTVMKINLTTQESSIEILNPTVYTTQTKGVGRPLEKSSPGKIQPTIGHCTSQ